MPRTLVAVGTARDASMLVTTRAAGPRSATTSAVTGLGGGAGGESVGGLVGVDEVAVDGGAVKRRLVFGGEDGLVVAPKFVPTWLRAWEDLVLHFAFSSFLQEIDLDSIARRYPWLTPNKADRAS